MKAGFYLCGLFLIFSLFNPISKGEHEEPGCFPLQPYLDHGKEIHNKHLCESQKGHFGGKSLNTCWVDSNDKQIMGTCYWVGNPSQCTCIQQGGTACNVILGDGGEFGYCLWTKNGDKTGCDAWQLDRKVCTAPGYKINNIPPNAEDLCILRGGTITDDSKNENKMCENFYSNQDKRTTCLLDDLWNGKCGFKAEAY